MNTVQFEDALCDIIAPITNIMGDEKVKDTIAKTREKYKGQTAGNIPASALLPLVAPLLKTHRDDVHTILSVLTGKTKKEIAEQPYMDTLKDIGDNLDGEIIGFFASALA